MTRPVKRKLSGLNVSSEQEMLPALQREVLPVLSETREAVNAMALVVETLYDWTSTSNLSEVPLDIPLGDGRAMTIEVEAFGTDQKGSWVRQRRRSTYERDDSDLGVRLVVTESSIGPYYGSGSNQTLSTASFTFKVNSTRDGVIVILVGEVDKPIRWSVYVKILEARAFG